MYIVTVTKDGKKENFKFHEYDKACRFTYEAFDVQGVTGTYLREEKK